MCGRRDSNPRTPERQGPKPCAFDRAWQPPREPSGAGRTYLYRGGPAGAAGVPDCPQVGRRGPPSGAASRSARATGAGHVRGGRLPPESGRQNGGARDAPASHDHGDVRLVIRHHNIPSGVRLDKTFGVPLKGPPARGAAEGVLPTPIDEPVASLHLGAAHRIPHCRALLM